MGFVARVVEVMIASPGDVAEERHVIREVLNEWNAVHARDRELVALPVGWETSFRHMPPPLWRAGLYCKGT